MKRFISGILICLFVTVSIGYCHAADVEGKHKAEMDELQKKFHWWPTDAKPNPVKDERGGYWWWPKEKGTTSGLWGNRGYVYVYKIIYDYKEGLPEPKKDELRASLLVKKIHNNVKIYFDFDKSDIREDAIAVLEQGVTLLNKNPETDILITGNCDIRGSEKYNERLGLRRGESVRKFMVDRGIPESRIKIVSRGKLDAIAYVKDLLGMAKDRNAQFMVAEVEEINIPYAGDLPEGATAVGEGKYIEEKQEIVESEAKVSTREYIIKRNDSLWKIAASQLGSGHRWKYLYELNKDRIKNPKKLKAGTKIIIPVE
ncbi:MAG: OmpA family protein [Candidatus Omnitrophota bacterium]|jgi:outer membrane protein OmpA-like peptidoglycan-associated protein|nr:OmpA family protein [Candidatus Omnitrophota bacterium]